MIADWICRWRGHRWHKMTLVQPGSNPAGKRFLDGVQITRPHVHAVPGARLWQCKRCRIVRPGCDGAPQDYDWRKDQQR